MTARLVFLAVLTLLALLIPGRPVSARSEILGPRWFQELLIYFNDFENPSAVPAINSEHLTVKQSDWKSAPGLFGHGLSTEGAPLELKGAALSPARPLTISFWWRLSHDLPIDGGFGQFSLTGKGFVSAFVRGKGEWCALQRPAGVCQVYDFGGIQNVNGIYDFDLQKSLDLHANIWHHTAAVFRGANTYQLYTDGKLVSEIVNHGRGWNSGDDLQTLTIGSGVILDDVAILNRAVDADLLADYFQGVQHLHFQ